jgi:hypothetical protein
MRFLIISVQAVSQTLELLEIAHLVLFWPQQKTKNFCKDSTMEVKREVVRSGITFGTALAIAISWSLNQSVIWAIIHGFLSWLYVIYYIIVN